MKVCRLVKSGSQGPRGWEETAGNRSAPFTKGGILTLYMYGGGVRALRAVNIYDKARI